MNIRFPDLAWLSTANSELVYCTKASGQFEQHIRRAPFILVISASTEKLQVNTRVSKSPDASVDKCALFAPCVRNGIAQRQIKQIITSPPSTERSVRTVVQPRPDAQLAIQIERHGLSVQNPQR